MKAEDADDSGRSNLGVPTRIGQSRLFSLARLEYMTYICSSHTRIAHSYLLASLDQSGRVTCLCSDILVQRTDFTWFERNVLLLPV